MLERPIRGWEAGDGGMSQPMSQLLGVESQIDRGQELNSSPALPPSPPRLPPSQTFRYFTHAQENSRRNFTLGQHSAIRAEKT